MEPWEVADRDVLRVENARLQERVGEAVERGVRLLKSIERLYEERRLIEEDFSPEAWEKILQDIERAETERDGYKALAERRGKALEMLWDYLGHSFDTEEKRFSVADFEDKWGAVEEAEQEWEQKIPAAIDATLEEAREKEAW